LKQAGYELREGRMINIKTGKQLEFEILEQNPTFERWINPFIRNLARIGIKAKLRIIDTSQMQNRVNNFDFDMIVSVFSQSQSPGNEQRDYWSSAKADVPGSRNLIGIKDPVVDELIDLIVNADSRESLVARTRALDRVLLWGHYVIPHWHINTFRIAYWNKFARPDVLPPFALPVVETWWIDQVKETALQNKVKQEKKD
jgi:microcin C transport system substrate-binding protein